MKTSYTFENLIVWQKAHSFVLKIYKLTSTFPVEEKYGLTNQFRRAVVSIAANIVEGHKKTGKKDKLRFFNISQGSIEECKYFLILLRDLSYSVNPKKEEKQIIEVSMLLTAYSNKIYKSL